MHEFWNKQPVPQDKAVFEKDGEIDSSRELKYEKVPLPEGYEWSSCTLEELCEFLKENYIRDEFFEFHYSNELVKWATYKDEWNLTIREKQNSEIIGFISGVPLDVRVNDKTVKMFQINFLCVSEKLRNIYLAPLLIKEITRRINLQGIWQAIYTVVKRLPTPISKVKYWHRLINVKKLNRVGFSNAREQVYRILGTSQFREMAESDIPRVTKMLRNHLNKFKLSLEIDESYVKHWILPRKDTVYTYLNDENEQFATFYSLDYVHKLSGEVVKQAYMFYNVGNCLKDAIIMARNRGFDVYNCVNVGIDEEELREHKFMEGTGHNHYYLWNWKISEEIQPKNIGFVIV